MNNGIYNLNDSPHNIFWCVSRFSHLSRTLFFRIIPPLSLYPSTVWVAIFFSFLSFYKLYYVYVVPECVYIVAFSWLLFIDVQRISRDNNVRASKFKWLCQNREWVSGIWMFVKFTVRQYRMNAPGILKERLLFVVRCDSKAIPLAHRCV